MRTFSYPTGDQLLVLQFFPRHDPVKFGKKWDVWRLSNLSPVERPRQYRHSCRATGQAIAAYRDPRIIGQNPKRVSQRRWRIGHHLSLGEKTGEIYGSKNAARRPHPCQNENWLPEAPCAAYIVGQSHRDQHKEGKEAGADGHLDKL